MSPRWSRVETPIYRWVGSIERILSAEPMPEFAGSVVNVFSDYGGDHQGSWYDVTGILYMDLHASIEWEARRRQIRKRYLADGRRLAFKSLGDRQRRDALVPFLEAADEIAGLCLVVAVRKSIVQLCVDAPLANSIMERLQLRRQWRHHNFERMVRVAHLVGLLVGGLSRPGQDIHWFSDEDAMFANEATAMDLREMLSRFSSHYTRHPLGQLGLGTTALDEGDRFEEDHVAVPDLAVGAVTEMITRLSSASGGSIRPHVAIPFADRFTPKTEVIYSWFAHRDSRLRKVCILFERLSASELAVSRLEM